MNSRIFSRITSGLSRTKSQERRSLNSSSVSSEMRPLNFGRLCTSTRKRPHKTFWPSLERSMHERTSKKSYGTIVIKSNMTHKQKRSTSFWKKLKHIGKQAVGLKTSEYFSAFLFCKLSIQTQQEISTTGKTDARQLMNSRISSNASFNINIPYQTTNYTPSTKCPQEQTN